jgi:hypothetical protein
LLSETDAAIGWPYDPRISPVGERVAMNWIRPDSLPDGLWIMPRSGAENAHIGPYIPLGWSADGRTVYATQFVVGRSVADRTVWVIDPDNGSASPYVDLPLPVTPRNLDITRDGRRIVLAHLVSQSDAWIIENFDPTHR